VQALRRLLPYYRRHRGPFWTGLLLLVAARVFEALIPQLLKLWVDGLLRGAVALGALAGGILACAAARYLSIRVGRRAIRRIGLSVAYHLRQRLYDHLQRQGPLFFARHRTGDLMARAINDIGVVREMVGLGTRTVFVLVFSAAVGFAFMLRESPSLTLWLLPVLPLLFVAALGLSRRVHRQALLVQAGFSTLSERTQENLAGIRTVQALGQEEQELRRFQAVNQDFVQRYLDLIRTNSWIAVVMPALAACATLVVIGFGGARVLAGEQSLGSFTAFLWYLGMVLWPVREAANMIGLFQRGGAALARLFELLDHAPEIADTPAPRAPRALSGALELRGLGYRYPGAARAALEAVSARIEAGQLVGVLGRVGAGKSTLLRLLVRLLDPPAGSVLLDGHDLRGLPLPLVRQQVALMPQEAFLFSEAVGENLAYDDPERPAEALEAAARAADLWETLERLPEGLATPVGERGVLLSGGQRQRLTLARALVREAPILLLDDPFSSVDSETEERILKHLARIRQGRTTLIVSHRVSALRGADLWLVLERGRLAELGPPAELLAADGPGARLARAQLRREALLAQLAAPVAGGGS
jgi:ATP-binding cassette subfamily B protein